MYSKLTFLLMPLLITLLIATSPATAMAEDVASESALGTNATGAPAEEIGSPDTADSDLTPAESAAESDTGSAIAIPATEPEPQKQEASATIQEQTPSAPKSTQSEALPIEMTTSVDKSTITLGDVFVYTLSIRYDPKLSVSLPGWGINLGQFEIRDYKSESQKNEDGTTTNTAVYHLSIYDTGSFTIPPVGVTWKESAEGDEKLLWSDSVTITVESVAPSEADDVRGLKSQAVIPPDYRTISIGAAIGAAVILLIVLIVVLIKRHRRLRNQPVMKPLGPPHELALAELEKLRASSLRAEGRIKEFYIELSEIVRRYLGRRFQVYTLERTSEEIMIQVETLYLDADVTELIGDFLNETDLVKFARYIPGDDETDACLDSAERIIDATKPVFTAPISTEGGISSEGSETTQTPSPESVVESDATAESHKSAESENRTDAIADAVKREGAQS